MIQTTSNQMHNTSSCNIKEQVKWWDKKRIWFNIFVGVPAIFYMINISPDSFGLFEILGALIYAVGANILYSIGILLELYDYVYMSNKVGFIKFRFFFFILGTLISVAYTIFQIEVYFFGPLVEL